MGECSAGEEPRSSVVDSRDEHHHLAGLSVMDGSLFPTMGVNPQLTIYAITSKLASKLATRIG